MLHRGRPRSPLTRLAATLTTVALAAAACGGDDGGGPQEQTEDAAVAAAVEYTESTLKGSPDTVYGYLNAECKEQVSRDEVRDLLLLGRAFIGDELDLGAVEVSGTIADFDGDAASVEIVLDAPEGEDLGLLELSSDEIDLLYENDRWVIEECDFGDTTEQDAEDLEAALAEIGVSATRDDPAPADLAVPIGGGFTVAVTNYEEAAKADIEGDGDVIVANDDEEVARVTYTVGFTGEDEPGDLSDVSIQLVGADSVEISQSSCGGAANEVYFDSRLLFTGAAAEFVSCFSGAPETLTGTQLAFATGFDARDVFFDPTVTAPSPTEIPSTVGPSPDGSLTDDRTSPAALGEAVDIGGDWTMTVTSFTADATDELVEANEFNDPPADGYAYALIGVTLAYTGSESSSASGVQIGVVGDSNVGASDCGFDVSDVPDELDVFSDVFEGGELSGNLCLRVATSDTGSFVAYAKGDFFEDDYEFFAVS